MIAVADTSPHAQSSARSESRSLLGNATAPPPARCCNALFGGDRHLWGARSILGDPNEISREEPPPRVGLRWLTPHRVHWRVLWRRA